MAAPPAAAEYYKPATQNIHSMSVQAAAVPHLDVLVFAAALLAPLPLAVAVPPLRAAVCGKGCRRNLLPHPHLITHRRLRCCRRRTCGGTCGGCRGQRGDRLTAAITSAGCTLPGRCRAVCCCRCDHGCLCRCFQCSRRGIRVRHMHREGCAGQRLAAAGNVQAPVARGGSSVAALEAPISRGFQAQWQLKAVAGEAGLQRQQLAQLGGVAKPPAQVGRGCRPALDEANLLHCHSTGRRAWVRNATVFAPAACSSSLQQQLAAAACSSIHLLPNSSRASTVK